MNACFLVDLGNSLDLPRKFNDFVCGGLVLDVICRHGTNWEGSFWAVVRAYLFVHCSA